MKTFDTLKYTKGAIAIGTPQEQAEYQAQQIAMLIEDTVATKKDLRDLEYRLIIKLGSMMVICMSILGYIIKS
ncbi:hypothetical protein UFOVP265_29 [uncultured Caudovirales phage]|jgi:hypothetical protein|uniref:Uncharacterized protein n=1 Tax=uncultured Caudovirales phage TaxID=2100421 RepID=A0A6J5LK63_9CAUD|nr:hypothetical protein UFOVP265_29 [uncultured Caudovirales phage]